MDTTTADAAIHSPDAHPNGYLSTACLHGLHGYCMADTGAAGTKTPAQCKFCGARCRCDHPDCHGSGGESVGTSDLRMLLEQARAEGRREADDAINWTTSCIGCAKRLDWLYAERSAGAEETARFIAAEIRGLYSTSGDRALLEAVAIAERHALGGPGSRESVRESSGGAVGTNGPESRSAGRSASLPDRPA